MACAAKSNAAYKAYNAARVRRPRRLAPGAAAPAQRAHQADEGARLRQGLPSTYDEPEAYAAGENYLPEGMQPPGWYQPTPRGLEGKIGQKLAWLREPDRKATEGGKQYARQPPPGQACAKSRRAKVRRARRESVRQGMIPHEALADRSRQLGLAHVSAGGWHAR